MAGPGDEVAAGAGGHGRLRASHADREQAIGTLKAAFVQGMLAKDELDARVGQAFASRTYAELAALTADLPTMPPAAQPPKPARPQGRQPVLRPGRWIAVASALYAGAWAYELFQFPHGGDDPLAFPLIAGGFLVYLGVLIVSVAAIIVNRQEKRSGRQPPRRPAPGARGPAAPRLRSAAADRQLPPARDDSRHTAETARSRLRRPSFPGLPAPRRGHPPGAGMRSATPAADPAGRAARACWCPGWR
jgi:hypothetical protein